MNPRDVPVTDLSPCHLRMGVVGRLLELADECGTFGRLREHLAHAEALWCRYQDYAGGAAYGTARRPPVPTASEGPPEEGGEGS